MCTCRKKNRKPVLHRVFRCQVAKSLISETNPPLQIVRGAVNPRDLDRLTGCHFISKIVQKEGQKSKLLRTCPVCNVPTGKRRTPGDARKVVRSTYECKDCDVGTTKLHTGDIPELQKILVVQTVTLIKKKYKTNDKV